MITIKKLHQFVANDWGISLLELMAALTLLSIVASGIITVLWLGINSYNREQLRAEAQYDASMALAKISIDIRESQNLGDLNPDAFEIRDKNNQPVPAGAVLTPTLMPMQLYLEKTEVINDRKVNCTVTYIVNSSGQLCRQRRVFETGSHISTTTITVNRVNTRFSQKGRSILCEITIIDEEGNQVFELVGTCTPRIN